MLKRRNLLESFVLAFMRWRMTVKQHEGKLYMSNVALIIGEKRELNILIKNVSHLRRWLCTHFGFTKIRIR